MLVLVTLNNERVVIALNPKVRLSRQSTIGNISP